MQYKNGTDPVIVVGATQQYSLGVQPKIKNNTCFGANYVDILAPGIRIPAIYGKYMAKELPGTSPAAAIVSGTLGLLVKCRPYSSFIEFKNALLLNARSNPELFDYVRNGAVLDIFSVVKAFCLPDEDDYEILYHTEK